MEVLNIARIKQVVDRNDAFGPNNCFDTWSDIRMV
jgi:hypothetical protein